MFQATKEMRKQGQEILAIYHSHPTSAPTPSRTDLERCYSPDVVHFIVGMAGPKPLVRGWWLTETACEAGLIDEGADVLGAEGAKRERLGHRGGDVDLVVLRDEAHQLADLVLEVEATARDLLQVEAARRAHRGQPVLSFGALGWLAPLEKFLEVGGILDRLVA